MYCEGTAVSCGVDCVYGFEDDYTEDTPCEEMLRDVSRAMWYDSATNFLVEQKKPARLAAAMYMFSDIRGAAGDRFGEWLIAHKLGEVLRMGAHNPNSGNDIVTYLWKPDIEALKAYPEWAAGKRKAQAQHREREKMGW